MRIGYLSSEFPALSETFVLHEILELRRRGHDVRVYSLRRPRSEKAHEAARALRSATRYFEAPSRGALLAGLLYVALRYPGRLAGALRFVRKHPEAPSLRWTLRRAALVALALRRDRREHVHVHFAMDAAEHALLVSLLTGMPYSLHAHAVDFFVHKTLLREKMDHARFVTTECEYSRRYLLEANSRFPPERLHVLRLGFDETLFRPSSEAGRREGPLRVAAVSRLVPKKGLGILVEAVARVVKEGLDAELWIAGDGPERASLEDAARRLGIAERVHLLGPCDSRATSDLLRACDLFALPCVVAENGDRDATPTALLEAQACGLPVVSTRIAGIPEIVPEGAGRLVPERDVASLASALRELLELPAEKRRRMGRVGREFVLAHHRLPVVATRLDALLEGDGRTC